MTLHVAMVKSLLSNCRCYCSRNATEKNRFQTQSFCSTNFKKWTNEKGKMEKR